MSQPKLSAPRTFVPRTSLVLKGGEFVEEKESDLVYLNAWENTRSLEPRPAKPPTSFAIKEKP